MVRLFFSDRHIAYSRESNGCIEGNLLHESQGLLKSDHCWWKICILQREDAASHWMTIDF